MADQYETIGGVAQSKLVVKKSRFIGFATATKNCESVEEFLGFVQTQCPGATHYCYAYKIKLVSQLFEYADDAGEPRNSAGAPILTVLKNSEFLNVTCVVARYYGGIKLGVGGLIRAYSECTRNCLNVANRNTEILCGELQVQVEYDQVGSVFKLLDRFNAELVDVRYNKFVNIKFKMRQQKIQHFQKQLDIINLVAEKKCRRE